MSPNNYGARKYFCTAQMVIKATILWMRKQKFLRDT